MNKNYNGRIPFLSSFKDITGAKNLKNQNKRNKIFYFYKELANEQEKRFIRKFFMYLYLIL